MTEGAPIALAGAYGRLVDEVRAFKESLARYKGGKVVQFVVGKPASDRDIAALEPRFDESGDAITELGDEQHAFPSLLKDVARVADGLLFAWQVRLRPKRLVSGCIHIPRLQTLQENKSLSFGDGELSWVVIGSAAHAEVVMPCDDDHQRVHVLTRPDSYLMAEDVSFPTLWETLMSHLGISGWELDFDETGYTARYGDIDGELEACKTAAREVREALRMPVPDALIKLKDGG